MNPKATWFWTILAATLFAFIFFFERHFRAGPTGPPKILPALKASAVTSVQILPKGQLEIRADRTNGLWQLTQPFAYPAKGASIEALLEALEQLTPATIIGAQELKQVRQADEKYGFEPPQKTLVLQQGDEQMFVHLGRMTAPGDQVFVQVVGVGDIYVVNADLLKWIPSQADEWRDPQLVDTSLIPFDRLLVTNSGKSFELQRNPTNRLWRMILPGWEPRADSDKVEEALLRLQGLRAEEFVSDDPKADLDSFGLQSPELTLALAQGTNTRLLLEFGRSPTNAAGQVYARRSDQTAVVTVSKQSLGPWPYEIFRDRHLVSLTAPLTEIDVNARDRFQLLQQTNGSWRVLPQDFQADSERVNQFITNLCELQVADFVKDVVTAPDLPEKGLAAPLVQFILKTSVTNATGTTNVIVTQLDFGTNQDNKIYVRRTDESSLYTVRLADLSGLPNASWQLRDRRVWHFTENDVARITVRQDGKVRSIDRHGTNHWSLAPGSNGIVNDLALDEVAHRLGELSAANWVARGLDHRVLYGFEDGDLQVSIQLLDGSTCSIEFGGNAPSGFPYATTSVDGRPWVLEFPWPLYQYIKAYLSIPAEIPR